MAHDVRPAEQSLGVRNCKDCHATDSPLFFGKTEVDSTNARALICGPPIMYKFVVRDLLKLNFARDEILLSLERRMKCGVGKCAHCQVGHKLTCVDGPVFTYFEAERLMESI